MGNDHHYLNTVHLLNFLLIVLSSNRVGIQASFALLQLFHNFSGRANGEINTKRGGQGGGQGKG